MTRDHWAELSGGANPLFVDPDFLDEAIVGITEGGVMVYSVQKLVEAYVTHEDLEPEDAMEHVSYNIVSAYVGERTPIYLAYTVEEAEETT